MTKPCICNAFYQRKLFNALTIFLEKKYPSCVPILPFLFHLHDDGWDCALMNINNVNEFKRALLPSFLLFAQTRTISKQVVQTKPGQAILETRHFTLKKLVHINKLQATRELMLMIKQLDICLTCLTSRNNNTNHIKENLLCRDKCKCLSVIWNELSTFIFFTYDPVCSA